MHTPTHAPHNEERAVCVLHTLNGLRESKTQVRGYGECSQLRRHSAWDCTLSTASSCCLIASPEQNLPMHSVMGTTHQAVVHRSRLRSASCAILASLEDVRMSESAIPVPLLVSGSFKSRSIRKAMQTHPCVLQLQSICIRCLLEIDYRYGVRVAGRSHCHQDYASRYRMINFRMYSPVSYNLNAPRACVMWP